jgi:hypothetical protein
MSYFDDFSYDYDDRSEITPDAVRECYNDIEALTRGYDDRHTYVRSVNRVFYDIFGIDKIGTAFASRTRDRRIDSFRVSVFKKIGVQRLIDMISNPETYEDLQDLVKLHYDALHTNIKRDKLDECASVYQDTIERIKRTYGIKTKSSVASRNNPLKSLRKKNRDFDDDRRGYDIYDDDFGFYDYGRKSYKRRYDEDYVDDDDDFINAILRGVEPVEGRKRSKKKRKTSSMIRDRFDDDDDDGDADEFESATADTISKLTDALVKLNDRIDALETSGSNDEDYYEPEDEELHILRSPARQSREPDPDISSGINTTLDALSRSVKTIALNQAKDRKDLNDVISIIRESLEDSDEEVDEVDGEEALPPNPLGGDLLKTQGGMINST